MKKLIIVESPNKCKSIQKYAGSDYIIKASCGHIRKLSDKYHRNTGVDVENNFEPHYVNSKSKQINALRDAMRKCSEVIIATDADREGHAIAWHLAKVLKLNVKTNKRIIFREITKSAINNALRNPTIIDMRQVKAQQSRQIMDKLVGYELSPLLWKFKIGKSAGRVQSVLLRLLVEKEEKIKKKQMSKNYKTTGTFLLDSNNSNFNINGDLVPPLKYTSDDSKNIPNKFLKQCKDPKTEFIIASIDTKNTKRKPPPPFKTTTLQRMASRQCGLSSKQTMSIAQKLYEGGHITYHRTDMECLSGDAIKAISNYILDKHGKKYLKNRYQMPSSPMKVSEEKESKSKKKKKDIAQDAHEAVRPTDINKLTVKGTGAEVRVYQMIWKRTVASQMESEVVEVTKIGIEIKNDKYKELENRHFVCKLERQIFDGYKVLFQKSKQKDIYASKRSGEDIHASKRSGEDIYASKRSGEEEEKEKQPTIVFSDEETKKKYLGAKLEPSSIKVAEKLNDGGGRYSESMLIKQMETRGIGRPSTIASLIGTILDREYAVKKDFAGIKVDLLVYQLIQTVSKDSKTREILEPKVEKGLYGAEKNKFTVTDSGVKVNEFLMKNFSDIVDYDFTFKMEQELDKIANGQLAWKDQLKNFYGTLKPNVDKIRAIVVPRFSDSNSDSNGGGERKRNILGEHEGKEVELKKGKFGLYLTWNGKNYSVKEGTGKEDLKEAIKIIELKEKRDKDTVIVGGKYKVFNGAYGPFFRYKNVNVSIPKDYDVGELTVEVCEELGKAKKEWMKNNKGTKGKKWKKKT